MRNGVCGAVLLSIAIASSAQAADLLCSNQVLTRSWDLLRDAGWGFKRLERAAFIVRTETGYAFVDWPQATHSYRADYAGRIPANAIAIIHTHPNELPEPSDGDAMTATRTGLAVYVLTRSRITEVSARRVNTTIWTGDWNPEAPAVSQTACHERTLVALVK